MKRMVLSVLWGLLQGGLWAQTHINVILVTNRPIGRVEASDVDRAEQYSVPYEDTTRFRFARRCGACYRITFSEPGKDFSSQLWLDAADDMVFAHIDGDSLAVDSVEGSPLYETVQRYNRTYAELYQRGDSAALNRFMLDAYAANRDNLFADVIGLSYLRYNANAPANLLRLKALVPPGHTTLLACLDTRLQIRRLSLQNFALFDKRRKKVPIRLEGADMYVLDFWYLQNAPCLEEHKRIKSSLDRLTAGRVRVIGVARRDDIATWKAYLSENDYGWPNYMDSSDGGLIGFLAIQAFPTYVVVDKDGVIEGVYGAFGDVMKALGFANPS